MKKEENRPAWQLPKDPTRFAANHVRITYPPTNVPVDYRRYYDLEAFLFEDVSKRFTNEGSIGAFDFFSIVIWKANRAKSKTAKRLRKFAKPGETFDSLCHRLTAELHRATTDEDRFRLLIGNWKFALPMASAILTVLYPQSFTVYDYRVCDQLQEFHNLANVTQHKRLWAGYRQFVAAVQTASPEADLRNKDRYLIGKELALQLQQDIERWFERSSAT